MQRGIHFDIYCIILNDMYVCMYVDDFNIEEDSVVFTPDSASNSTACFSFTPVDDVIIEDNEMFGFYASARNERDVFESSDISITIYDDDGKTES